MTLVGRPYASVAFLDVYMLRVRLAPMCVGLYQFDPCRITQLQPVFISDAQCVCVYRRLLWPALCARAPSGPINSHPSCS